jgi:hypothetical protein
MYRSLSLSEDQALKETVANRAAASSPFAWREILATAERNPIPEITVTRAGNEEQFSLADVADAIGESLTNLLISRETPEDDIFLRAKPVFRFRGGSPCFQIFDEPGPAWGQPQALPKRSLPPHRKGSHRK